MQKNEDRTIQFTLPWDDMPIDISHVFADEAPAGKHGFLKAQGEHFVFEDGTRARFWGTNFNSNANFPSHEYSKMVAKRLAKTGLNMVRFHQLDGDWSTPNIFQFSKGKYLENTRTLDPESMDRLDYLIYCLKAEGIYCYMDLLTYRRFRSGDGVENAVELPDAARPQSNFDEHLIELQKEFCTNLWNHVNPYTGLAYKDDPAIAMTEIVNENEIFGSCGPDRLKEPYRTRLEDKYYAYCAEKGITPRERPVNFKDNTDDIALFKIELQKKYYEILSGHMRSLGVKIPIAGTNWTAGGAGLIHSEIDMDFTDCHAYFYDWKWRPQLKQCESRTYLGNRFSWADSFPYFRLCDRPFFISEWDEPWPNEYRGESPLYIASICALQGWGGATIHTYRYDCRENVDMIAAPITSEALSGVPYRSGVFDCFNDPAKYGLFYHAALLFRRADVKESSQMQVYPIPGPLTSSVDFEYKDPYTGKPRSAFPSMAGSVTPGSGDAPEKHEYLNYGYTGTGLMGKVECCKAASRIQGIELPANAVERDPAETVEHDITLLKSDTGEMCRDIQKRIATIDTDRTKAVYGFLGAAGEIRLPSGFTVKCRNSFAVIAISSLDDKPISESKNLLLSTVGRADNTDAKYSADHMTQFDKGHGPIEAEVIEAEISWDTQVTGYTVEAVNSNGMLIGRSPAAEENGRITVTLGGDFPSIYYLIQKR